ncbi:bifunctional enoyl-CoA hydratase/phosphate acetyltransferase [Methyloligella sp. 2.7D]|uniref:bifunctional enoyl-CoA hydratase/phosphate acetyltransferase n=1 Tax=unclassified Methyloligella TaxID=2625955 RepID=UPI00157DC03B|nr:bifunctional enoyl-CoA hydratase/phosphate acetyltransferase [Methyloligella sp. GL2]QKP76504.1 bifunctional enoyl-CoA hydratase/phosphate acetyltransferase [Methyloligella sp. GL2]
MSKPLLTNRTFDELQIGDTASLVRLVGDDDIKLFAAVSGDVNPAHVDAAYAAHDSAGHVVVHGLWTGSLISALLGTELPGPGTVYVNQDFNFKVPVAPGDTITATVTVREKDPESRMVVLDTVCANERGEEVLTGTAKVIAPTEKLAVPRMALPEVTLHRHDRYERFVAEAKAPPPLATAVVHPCSPEAVQAAIEARDEGLIAPLLVGPEAKIRAAAETAGVSLDGLTIECTEHSHAAAERAVELAAAGTVDALMKGSLHTNELLGAVVASGSGLRTERRISHVYVLDVPAYPKPLIVTDAAINIAPSLDQKRDICQNAIDLLHRLGIEQPLVAVLAAVETVDPAMPATVDAAALAVMAKRGQITGALVDGPLAFDNAVSFDAARIKEITSPVAGQADILLVPDLEAGNMLAKQLIYLGGADAAGLVLGARVPIILTSRADSLKVRLASAALAKLAGVDRPAGFNAD